MAASVNKIAANSPSRSQPSELEVSIATALYDLESNTPDMKAALRPLQFVSAREVLFDVFLPFFFKPKDFCWAVCRFTYTMRILEKGEIHRSIT